VNNDSALLGILDGIIFEETIGTFTHFMKVQTILSLNAYAAIIGQLCI